MRTPRVRTLGEFAEQEIILPDGPFAGRPFRLDRSPVARLLFNELDSGRWRRASSRAPTRTARALLGFVIPVMYLLFERRETVILGVPTLDMVKDKWRVDIAPVIAASKYKDLCPQVRRREQAGREHVLFSSQRLAPAVHDRRRRRPEPRRLHSPRTSSSPRPTASTRSAANSREGDKFASSSGARWPSATPPGRGRVHRQHGAGPDVAGNPARHQQPDRMPCPHCRLGHPRARALRRLAGRETELDAAAKGTSSAPRAGRSGRTSSASRPTTRPCSPTRARRSTPTGR
jgi:hypothetical protein